MLRAWFRRLTHNLSAMGSAAFECPEKKARVFVVLVCLCIVGITAWRVHLARVLELHESRTATANLARSLAEHAHATVEVADVIVSGLAERIEREGAGDAALPRLQQHMMQRVLAVPRIRGLTVLAADGTLLATAWAKEPLGSRDIDAIHLAHHRQHFDAGPFLGPPVRDQVSGTWMAGISRRVEAADGTLGGIAIAVIDCDTFTAFYDSFEIGAHGSIALTNEDGTMLVRVPPTPAAIGRNIGENTFFQSYRHHGPVGNSEGVSTLDGEKRWNSFRKVEGYPLVVFVALSEADILAAWSRDAVLAMTISLAITVLLGVVGWRLAGQIGMRAATEGAIRRSEAQYRLLAENSTDLITQLGPDGRRRYVSPASEQLLGYTPQELLGVHPSGFAHPEDWPAVSAALHKVQQDGSAPPVSFRARRKDGSEIWLEATCRRLEGGQGVVAALRDVSRQKAAEAKLHAANNQLQRLVMLDGLTGIANRRCLDAVLEKEFRRAARAELPLSLLLIDVDHFKGFNDLYGHVAGDACLRTIAAAVAEGVQRPADLAARFGGEEFAVLLAETDVAGALTIGERVRLAVRNRAIAHGGAAAGVVTVSVGVASIWPRHDREGAEQLVLMADAALYRAKAGGRDRIALGCQPAAPVELPGVQRVAG